MKKIPTAFKRVYEEYTDKRGRKRSKIVDILPEYTDDLCREAVERGVATLKLDGAACAIIEGNFYRRYDAKKGKTPPEGAIECSPPDPKTGHHPFWIPVSEDNPSDKWFREAYKNAPRPREIIYDEKSNLLLPVSYPLPNGTFEAIGPHFQGNPYGLEQDILVPHGKLMVYLEPSFEGIKQWLEENEEEGIVFWLHDRPICKIKRSDFGLEWPIKKNK